MKTLIVVASVLLLVYVNYYYHPQDQESQHQEPQRQELQRQDHTPMETEDYKASFENTKTSVVRLAQEELLRHYPDGLIDGKKYEMISAVPFTGSSNWLVTYDLVDVEDARIEIIIDPVVEKVVSYRDDDWS